jgi:UDP-4-amino-4,6-dideoxy-N-acetyl-beta-L-altrosamine transaminase
MKSIPYGKQDVRPEDIEAVAATLKSDFLTQGPKVQEFEANFAKYVGAKYAVAVSNATAALHLGSMALNKKNNKKVIVPAITFAASSNGLLYENIPVEFIDIDPKTFLIDLNLLEDTLKKNPNSYQGVVPVDLAGYPVAAHELKTLCDKYGLWIMEDACHAPGAEVTLPNGKKYSTGNGEYNDLSIFSFHPVKHIASGEGGMVTTNSQDLFEKISTLRSHGIVRDQSKFRDKSQGGWYHEMQSLGYNYRMPDINAALGNSQLSRAQQNLSKRLEIASFYDKNLEKFDLELPYRAKNIKHAFHLYVVQTDRRRELYDFLKQKNIYSQVHYIPVYWHPHYQDLGFKKGLCPKAENYYSRALSIPMYPSLTHDELQYVVETIGEFFDGK